MWLVREPISRAQLAEYAAASFGDMVKAVVDVERALMVVGGDMHADKEQVLLADGSRQANLWGINLYPSAAATSFIEFDAMINVRPRSGNPSREVVDPAIR